MSLLNIGFLNEAITEKKLTKPHEVLNHVRKRLVESISQQDQKDGMDGIILCIDQSNGSITYAAANNAPVVIRDNKILEMPFDRMPIGKGEKTDSFNTYALDLSKGDVVYLYSDGYADQFGGPLGKKFKYKQLNSLLAEISDLALQEQQERLNKVFEDWRGPLEQVDDVCVVGLKL